MIARLLCTLLAGLGFLAGLLIGIRVAPELGDPRAVRAGRAPRNPPTRRSRPAVGQNADRPAAAGGSGTSRKRGTGAPTRRRKKKSP